MNVPNFTMNIHKGETYNTGCLNEIETIIQKCTDFKTDVTSDLGLRFKIGVIILFILIFFRIFTIYKPFKFQQSEFYKNYVEFRIDFILLVLVIMLSVFFFV